MKHLFYEKETNTKAQVTLIYPAKPPQELLDGANYIEIENLPEPEQTKGKSALLYCNPETNDIWYEYVDRSLTEEQKKIKELEEKLTESESANRTIMFGLMEVNSRLRELERGVNNG